MNTNSSNKSGNPKRLKILALNVGRNWDGNNLLHKFVINNSRPNYSGSENYVNAVLLSMKDVSFDANQLNINGYSALHLAVIKNNLSMVKQLLSCLNIHVDTKDREFHNTALHVAANFGYLCIVKELIGQGANVNMQNRHNDTVLCCAARHGHLDVAKLLINKGANVNPEVNGFEPLHLAALYQKFDVVKLLVHHGANVNAVGVFETTAIKVAFPHLGIVKFLLSNGADLSDLDFNFDFIKTVIDSDATINFNNENSWKLLTALTKSQDFKRAEILINKGADVNAKDKTGCPLLHWAVQSSNLESVIFFVNNNADINALNAKTETPLIYAVNSGNLEIVKFLVDNGVDINGTDADGHTPRDLAMKTDNMAVAEYLVNNGAVKSKKAKGNKTAHD